MGGKWDNRAGREGKPMGRPEKIRLGDTLVAQNIISPDQLKISLEQQKKTGRRLGRVLIEQGFVNEEQICEAISRQLNIPYINLKFYNFNNDLVRRLPEAQARRFRAVVLEERKGAYLVGMADPTDLFAFDEIARLLRRDIEAAVVSEALLLQREIELPLGRAAGDRARPQAADQPVLLQQGFLLPQGLLPELRHRRRRQAQKRSLGGKGGG